MQQLAARQAAALVRVARHAGRPARTRAAVGFPPRARRARALRGARRSSPRCWSTCSRSSRAPASACAPASSDRSSARCVAAGHDVAFVPADFRRFEHIARDARAARDGDRRGAARRRRLVQPRRSTRARRWTSCAAAAAIRSALLIAEANARLPRTLGLPPEHPHALHVDEIDVLVRERRAPVALPETPADRGRARDRRARARASCPTGATLQTGIGGVPDAVAEILAGGPGGDYGVHSEMFTTGLMQLHQRRQGEQRAQGRATTGVSIATFAMGTRALYAWLGGEGRELVRFLPVDAGERARADRAQPRAWSRSTARSRSISTARSRPTRSAGREHSGIGGHEDFVMRRGVLRGRALARVPAVDRAASHGTAVSRIVAALAPGTLVTTPRHQVDVVITEYGAAELAGRSERERARGARRDRAPGFRASLSSRREGR